MKKIIVILGLLLYGLSSHAQTLTGGEYFFDTAPASGGGIPFSFTPSDTVSQTLNVSVTSLATGFHNMFIRVKNSTGIWSHYEGRLFYIIPPTTLTSQPALASGEWFVDTDPGLGNGTAIAFSQKDTVNQAININTTGLSIGFHNLFVRVKNASGVWSHYEGRLFYIIPPFTLTSQPDLASGEWFVDTDPGLGKGTAITFSQNDTVNQVVNINTTGFTPGFHNLFIRVKNLSGIWSHFEGRLFYVIPAVGIINQSMLASGEWFIDTDPGLGKGTAISFAAADTVNPIINISTVGLSLGTHHLFIRVKNTDSKWSLYEGRKFTLCNDLLATPVITGETVLCTGGNLILDAGIIPGALSYRWNGPDGFTAVSQSITIKNVTGLMSGVYSVAAIKGSSVCDSSYFASVSVTINTIDASVSQQGAILTANASGKIYQWLDCNNGNAPIQGEINQNFSPVKDGNYAVLVTNNFCSQMSSCINFLLTDVFDAENITAISVYPNPVSDLINVKVNIRLVGSLFSINDALGRTLITGKLLNELSVIDISGLTTGMYFLKVGGQNQQTFKLIKK